MGRWGTEDLPIDERFWLKVNKNGPLPDFTDPLVSAPPTPCFQWIASTTLTGYGCFWNGERLVGAHRYIFELETGLASGNGLEIDHLCRNPGCVNIDHLELVSQVENTRRGRMKEAQDERNVLNRMKRTECPYGHPLEGDNVYEYRGSVKCVICTRRASGKYRAIKRDNKPTAQERAYLRERESHHG